MRYALALPIVVALLLAAPVVTAAPQAKLELFAPESVLVPWAGNTSVSVSLRFDMSDVLCFSDVRLPVQVTAHVKGGSVSPAHQTIELVVPEGSYRESAYHGEANLTFDAWYSSGQGFVEISAELADEEPDCFAAGGFPTASANTTVMLEVEDAPEVEPEPDANATTGNDTVGGGSTNTSPTPGDDGKLPPGYSYVNDKEEESSRAIPTAGFILAAASLAIVALRLRRD